MPAYTYDDDHFPPEPADPQPRCNHCGELRGDDELVAVDVNGKRRLWHRACAEQHAERVVSTRDPLEARLLNALITARTLDRWPCGVTVDDDEEPLVEALLAKYRAAGWKIDLAPPQGMSRRPWIRVAAPLPHTIGS